MSETDDEQSFRAYLANKLADPDSSKLQVTMAKYGLSQLDMQENDFDRSMKEIKEVMQAYPNRKILLDDEGVIQLRAGRLESALQTLTQAYQQNLDDYYATYSLARVEMRLHNLSKAERFFKIVADEMPEYAQVYYDLGQIKADQNKTGDSTYYLANYYFYSGKIKLAKETYKSAIQKKGIEPSLKKNAQAKIKLIDRVQKEKL